MNTIEFRLSAFHYERRAAPLAVANIFIDGKNVLDTLYEFERRKGLPFIEHAPLAVAELHENLSERYKPEPAEICSQMFVKVEVGAEIVTWKNFGEFVFDKAQYFREVEKLQRWRFNDKLIFEYDGIECGFVSFNFMTGGKVYNFIFDELLSDPFTQLVNLFVHVERGEFCAEEFDDTYDDSVKVLKISVHPNADEVCLTVEIIKKKILLTENYRREELAAMFKKIFDALLNDKYFPYSYPCFWYLGEDDEDAFDKIISDIEAEHPYWTDGDVWNYAAETKGVKLAPRHEKYLALYRKMLTDYIIPDKWLD